MNLPLGATISVTSPWALLTLPLAIGLLVYIFRVRGTSKSAVVSSLFILRQLPQQPIGRKTFIPPLQFWLELITLASLIMAIAGLALNSSNRRIAIIIDASLSMAAADKRGETRLTKAKRIAALDISKGSESNRYSIFSAAELLTQISEPLLSRSEAISSVQTISQSVQTDALNQHLTAALQESRYDQIWIYTDQDLNRDHVPSQLIFNHIAGDPLDSNNAWIRSLHTDAGGSISVSIGLSGSSDKRAIIQGECFQADLSSTHKLAPIEVRLLDQSGGTAEIFIQRPSWDFCRIALKLKEEEQGDAITIDNEAWIAREAKISPISVVSSLTLEQLGLEMISNMNFKSLSASLPSLSGQESSTLFHRVMPPRLPTTPTLLVMPPQGETPWGGRVRKSDSTDTEISRWDDSHPILAYVKSPLITLNEHSIIDCPSSAVPILYSKSGALLCAGEEQGVRYAITGFELFPFDGAKDPTLSILTLNLLHWIFDSSILNTEGTLPSTISVSRDVLSATYLSPISTELEVKSGEIATNGPGVIALKHSDGSIQLLALNSASDRESNLLDTELVSVNTGSIDTRSTQIDSSSFKLIPLLVSLALLAIAADLARRILSRKSWGDT